MSSEYYWGTPNDGWFNKRETRSASNSYKKLTKGMNLDNKVPRVVRPRRFLKINAKICRKIYGEGFRSKVNWIGK